LTKRINHAVAANVRPDFSRTELPQGNLRADRPGDREQTHHTNPRVSTVDNGSLKSLKMDRFVPHPDYAEDQPYSRTILTTHVLHRGANLGAALGSLYGGVRFGLSAHARKSPLIASVVRGAGVGVVAATGLAAVALSLRMYGKQEIEWQDRSWRLLENKPQNRIDEWSASGALVGGVLGGVKKGLGWRGVVGSAGIGSVVGIVGWIASNKLRGKEEQAKVAGNSGKGIVKS